MVELLKEANQISCLPEGYPSVSRLRHERAEILFNEHSLLKGLKGVRLPNTSLLCEAYEVDDRFPRESGRVFRAFVSITLSLAAARVALADLPCTPLGQEISLKTSVASAGFFANLRNARHSVRFRTDQMLEDARAAAQTASVREAQCKRSCSKPVITVIFRSTPYRYLTDHEDTSLCEELLEKTSKSPIVYDNRRFPSDDAAREWYRDLTQGDGDDGEDLYRRCPGACSPTYSSVAYRQGEELIVSTSIICGHVRDKDDDQYTLSTALRWVCQ